MIMLNLLCRLPNSIPRLQGLSKIASPYGVVSTLMPYNWLDQFTTRELKVMGENGFEKMHEEKSH